MKWNETGKKLTGMANWVVRLVGGAILFVLLWYSLRFTQYMVPMQGYEYPVDTADSEWMNLLAAMLVIGAAAAGFWLEKRLQERVWTWVERTVLGIAMLWQGVWGFFWVSAADRCPKGDQESVFKAAAGFLAGDYHALGKNGYCEIYPHQLGLASLEELIFRIVGKPDYHVIQLIFVAMAVGEVCFVYGILKESSKHRMVRILGTLSAGGCMAPVFYTCWVYGELPFVFFALLAAWMLARYLKRGRSGALAGFVAAVTLGVLVRKNMLILVIAFCLTGGVYAIVRKDKRIALTILLAVLVPNLCYGGIYKMYELRSGYAHAEGLPANGYIHIGLMETEGRYGWDYLDSNKPYYQNGRDTDLTREAYSQMIVSRLEQMQSRPGYLTAFFKGKILSQWNAPLYQSMYFNYVHEDVHNERVTVFLDRLSGDLFDELLWGADRLQFVIYLGAFLYFVLCVKKDSDPARHLLAVTVIGGFLFSVLWEAKTRYVFPYYMMMFPMAALGYGELIGLMGKFRRRSGDAV